jgi:1,4-dihydroxy-2-naphthoyl-CoA hydrolase
MDANGTTAAATGGPSLDAASLEEASAFLRAAGLVFDDISGSRVTGHLELGPGHHTPFLRPVTAGRVSVEAVPLSQGRTQQLWRVDITDGAGKLVAHGEVRLQNVAGQ